MWQRIASTKSTVAAPLFGVFCTAVAVSMNKDVNTMTADAFSVFPSSSSPPPPSFRGSTSSSSSNNNAPGSFFHGPAIHRSLCDVSSSSSTSLLSSPSSQSPRAMQEEGEDSVSSNATAMATSSAGSGSSASATQTSDRHSRSYERVQTPERGTMKEHAIFGTLWGDTMIENYEVFRPARINTTGDAASGAGGTGTGHSSGTNTERRALVVVAHVKFGKHLNGHNGIVHGGILSLMFDDIMGFACEEVMKKMSQSNNDGTQQRQMQIPVTANLNVDFRKPVLEGIKVRMEVNLEHREGRKIYWKARMFGDADDGEDKDVLYAEATSLYILVNK